MPHAQQKTLDDYLALDDEGRTELLDGAFVVSPSPLARHQYAVIHLGASLLQQVERLQLGRVDVAPLDVVLSPTTVVHPDVLFVATAHLARMKDRMEGPPDLVVEILSPSNTENDLELKMRLYREHGVPHYWIGDTEARTIRVLENAGDRWIDRGTFGPGSVIRPAGMPGVEVAVDEVFDLGM